MPTLLKPNSNFPVVLDVDKDEPSDKQPRFICRCLSKSQWLELASLNESLTSASTIQESSDVVTKITEVGLVGWENMIDPETGKEIPFDLSIVDDILTAGEAAELMMHIVSQVPSAEDKKKSDSQSHSDTEESAATAKGQENAKTSPAK